MAIAGTAAMVSASVQWAFYFKVTLVPSALLILVGTVVVIAVALTPVGMRRIKKMDLVEKVKDWRVKPDRLLLGIPFFRLELVENRLTLSQPRFIVLALEGAAAWHSAGCW